jgi:ribonuclease HI
VEVSTLSKEDQAIAHASIAPSPRLVSAYTDASAILDSSDSKGIGTGLVILGSLEPAPLYKEGINIGPNQQVYNKELEAIARASEVIASRALQGYSYRVYADNQASLLRLANLSDQPGQAQLIRVLRAYKTIIARGAQLSFHWVPGHCGVIGNELADSIAKESTSQEPQAIAISLAHLSSALRALSRQAWARAIGSLKPTTNPNSYRALYTLEPKTKINTPRAPRELLSALYQLKLGHGYTRSYLYRLGHASNNRCNCGREETPRHLLLGCPELAGPRASLKDKLGTNRLTLELLLGTSQGVTATLDFLRKTKISNRRWYLDRNRGD